MNMPEVDKYGTVAPHTLIRQHMDHGHWYVCRLIMATVNEITGYCVHHVNPQRT